MDWVSIHPYSPRILFSQERWVETQPTGTDLGGGGGGGGGGGLVSLYYFEITIFGDGP